MQKTIHQWLQKNLTPEQFENAKKCKKDFINWEKEEADALSHAIRKGFWWEDMPEGYDYWETKVKAINSRSLGIEDIKKTLRECVTDDGASCFNGGKEALERRLKAINTTIKRLLATIG